jgi:hypothetical protein
MWLRLLCVFGIFTGCIEPISAASRPLSWFFQRSLSFSPHVFDGLVMDNQMQQLRDFFYGLPWEIEAASDKNAIEWLKQKAFRDPSLAYMAARVLQARQYPEAHWTFYAHLHLLYVALCSSRCLDQSFLQEKAPQAMFKKHLLAWNMLHMTPAIKAYVVSEIKRWRTTVQFWSELHQPSQIFFYEQTFDWGFGSSITYLPWTDRYESKFLLPRDEESIACIEFTGNQVYDAWIHELESKK